MLREKVLWKDERLTEEEVQGVSEEEVCLRKDGAKLKNYYERQKSLM
jgi:hypothetical protein